MNTTDMSKSKIAEMDELGNQIRFYIYRIPKKNHDKMVQNQKEFTDVFRKHGGGYKGFQLTSTETSEGFTSITTVLSANQDEEVWMDLESYRDGKHMDDTTSKIMDDKSALSLMKEYLALLSPGSSPIRAEFRRLKN
jgi:uncharacterized protein YbaA (DUF1428 family)